MSTAAAQTITDTLALAAAKRDLHLATQRLNGALHQSLMTVLEPIVPSKRSREQYAADIRAFITFAISRRALSLPADPEIVIAFFLDQVGDDYYDARYTALTADRRLTAIGTLHRALDLPNPCDHKRVSDIRVATRNRWEYRSPENPRFGPDLLLSTIAHMDDDDLATIRDRAIFLIGFVAYLAPNELQTFSIEHISQAGDILSIQRADTLTHIHRETDSLANICPIRALELWLSSSGIVRGPIFRALKHTPALGADPEADYPPLHYQTFVEIFKRRIDNANIPGAHNLSSLRFGFLGAAQPLQCGPYNPDTPILLSRFYKW